MLLNPRAFGDLFSLHDKITRLFEDEAGQGWERKPFYNSYGFPVTDIMENNEEYVFKMEVPGMAKEDIIIEFCEGNLCVKGERKENGEVKRENFTRSERFAGAFSRSFSIPKNVETDKIRASMKDGILELRVPKSIEKKATSIPIEIK